jgi:hypothetical protein
LEIQKAILPLIQLHRLDKQKLISLANALRNFPDTNEEWVNTMCIIANTFTQIDNSFSNYLKIFGSFFYSNLGSKSRVGRGIPYNEDLAKKNLLEKIIKENTYNTAVMDFLKKCLKKVTEDIDNLMKEDDDETNW